MKNTFLLVAIALFLMHCAEKHTTENNKPDLPKLTLDELAITLAVGNNREFSYTDKWSGYYYARTHSTLNQDWFSGWNISTFKVMQDYQLFFDGTLTERSSATATVKPQALIREYPQGKETFRMFDHQRVLEIEVETSAKTIGMALHGDQLQNPVIEKDIVFYELKDNASLVLAVSGRNPSVVKEKKTDDANFWEMKASANGFFIAVDSSQTAARELIYEAQGKSLQWGLERTLRMERLITQNNLLKMEDKRLEQAIKWNILTLDQLVMKQTGYGIYAGLPWFNDYWGRDMFITLPGACLVTGQFDIARKILTDFAKYQNQDAASKNYGRVPNRLRIDDIIYNTTDGTPRWVMALYDYVNYSGDEAIIEELYPAIQRSIEGPMKYWADAKGYLTHADADTWMDAKIDNTIPWSPRGNRAIDIQALWYNQLLAGTYFANKMGNATDAKKWASTAQKLKKNFNNDFIGSDQEWLADRLLTSGKADFTLRPNQLFALDLVEDQEAKWKATRNVWDKLVYPWGVASLTVEDEHFHPLHENWDWYHKDAAYHNGTVWTWNNGAAMQRMIEANQHRHAWKLFEGMVAQTLDSGAIGSLAENTNAYPLPGATAARLTGTFLQAWSTAEFLRVWYQHFLGIRPEVNSQKLIINPSIPTNMKSFGFSSKIGEGKLTGTFNRKEEYWESWIYTFEGFEGEVTWWTGILKPFTIEVKSGDKLTVALRGESRTWEWLNAQDTVKMRGELFYETEKEKLVEANVAIFEGVDFARPLEGKSWKSIEEKAWLRKKLEGNWKK